MPVFTQNNYNACGLQSGIWDYDTVFVQCDVTVPTGDLLQISAGTKVIFNGHYSIHVQGVMKALGSLADTILFTVSDTSGFADIHSNNGGWNGIRFEDTPSENDSSQFSFCRFSFGKAVGDSSNCYGGAFRVIRFNKIAIRNSTIDNNYSFYWGGGLYAFKSNLILDQVKVSDNYSGNDGMIYGYGGGLCFVSSDPDLRFMRFERNRSTGIGGGASFEFSSPSILNCVFKDNFSGLGGALGFLRSTSNRLIANLLIANNEALFFGGGIANVSAQTAMTNVTIVNNYASMGGGFYCNETSNTKLYNSVIWGNTSYDSIGSQVWIWDVFSEPGFYYSAVQHGIALFGGSTFHGEYINCTESDPLFADPTAGNFRILPDGSCFNSGTMNPGQLELPLFDLDMLERIQWGLPDIGAYECSRPVFVNDHVNDLFTARIDPVPATSQSVVRIDLAQATDCTIQLLDRVGHEIYEKQSLSLNEGQNQMQLSALFPGFENRPSGIYFVRIWIKNQHSTLRIVH